MIYGMYLSAQGAESQAMRQAVLANNMANAGTNGFKRDVPVFKAHQPFDLLNPGGGNTPEALLPATGGVTLEGTVTDFEQGSINHTGRRFDLALLGQGFFQVGDGDKNFLTRDGSMTLNSEGTLVHATTGLPVLDPVNKPIVIPPTARDVKISEQGVVNAFGADGVALPVGQVAMVMPASLLTLQKQGDSLYVTPDPLVDLPPLTRMQQGALEMSGSDPMEGTMELIETSRGFESNINMIRMQDEMLGQLLQSIPKR